MAVLAFCRWLVGASWWPRAGRERPGVTYTSQDSYSGADFAKKEVQNPDGVVTGEYRVALPDGRIQIVTYTADHYNGYVADVRYEGAAAYPAAPHHGPAPYKAPHHAPVHHAPVHHAPLHHGLGLGHGPGPAHGGFLG